MVFRQIEMEIMGTFVINFVVGYVRLYDSVDGITDAMETALVHGAAVALLVMFAYPHARCHFTPVLTVAEMIWGNTSVREGLTLIFSQFIGLSVSVAVQYVCLTQRMIAHLTDTDVVGFVKMDPEFSVWNHFVIELVFSAILVYASFVLANPAVKGPYWVEFYGAMRGVIVMVALLVGEPMRYVTLNPSIVLVCDLLNQQFYANQWPYYVGPLVGIAIGGNLYKREAMDRILSNFRVSK